MLLPGGFGLSNLVAGPPAVHHRGKHGSIRCGMLAVGDGEIAICPIPGRAGDYPGDLDALLRWHPGLVLTMTTSAGARRAGAARLEADLASRGIAWHHLPIADFGAPGPLTARLWPAAASAGPPPAR